MLDKLRLLEQESLIRHIPIIGSLKGRWLFDKIRELNPKKILELGSANGYSGCILGSSGAELTTIEIDERIALEAKENFDQFNIDARMIVGDAVKEIKKFSNDFFDIIFIDFMKKKYIEVLDECIRIIKNNGFIIADNINFENCQDFKQAVLSHPYLKTEIIDIKDGLSFSQKVQKV